MEVYGTKPKRFTKEWWEYFWDYYKWHTIAVVIASVAIISTAVECAHRTNYDLHIDYVSEIPLKEDTRASLASLAESTVDDVTENGKAQVFINYLDMGDYGDPRYTQAMMSKFFVEIASTESFVFLVSQKYADTLIESQVFEDASVWCSAPAYKGCCVSLADCKYLKNIGIDTEDLYLGIIKLRDRDRPSLREKNIPKHNNGIKFAKFLINEE